MAYTTIESSSTPTTSPRSGAYVLGVGSLGLILLGLGVFDLVQLEPLLGLLATVIMGAIGSVKEWDRHGPGGDVPPGTGTGGNPVGAVIGPTTVRARSIKIEHMTVNNHYYAAVPEAGQHAVGVGAAG